jgi:Domain of unknown function (DUF1998)
MIKNPIRRAQLIAPFGVGAMMVVKDGTSLISGGLDHWYEYEKTNTSNLVNKTEFRVEEWRLQRLLNVDDFRLPPDYRDVDENVPNKYLRVPFLRFPQWHFCPGCKSLYQLSLTAREKPRCQICAEKDKRRFLAQVPFVAMCEKGHIQDFPWTEWVHKSVAPSCGMRMRIVATGGSSLGAQIVKCECGMERSLSKITTEDILSKKLDKNDIYYGCQGKKPWLGTEESSPCGGALRGSLRSASNLYYPDVRTAIYLPRGNSEVPQDLITLLEEPPLSSSINVLAGLTQNITPHMLRDINDTNAFLLKEFTDTHIEKALQIITSNNMEVTNPIAIDIDKNEPETAFRREEFEILRASRNEETLIIKESCIDHYSLSLNKYFSRINLISKLRETRVLAGFTRILPENDLSFDEKKSLLRRTSKENWLPAYVVHGEGIFLELNEQWLQRWEERIDVSKRASPLIKQYQLLTQNKKIRHKPIGSRFILLHTFAHLLINRLTFECGYGAAALRERLYVSDNLTAPMAALLIYTAAGDSEGTMGGLVRMGQIGKLEPVIQRALLDAEWCSADPVCMETGLGNRQGADSYNLAACHNCALIPETACEEFNRFLDRGLVVGKVENRELGYFAISV